MSSATDLPSRAFSMTKSVIRATLSGWLSLTPLASRPRATSAASAIISLSFSRGVRFMIFSVPWRALTGPHLRHPERAASQLAAELLEKILQGDPQVVERPRGKANDDKPANRCRGVLALQRANNVAQKIQPRVGIGPGIDERS